MPETYTFVVPFWGVVLLAACQVFAASVSLWRTVWLRRQVRIIEAQEPPGNVRRLRGADLRASDDAPAVDS